MERGVLKKSIHAQGVESKRGTKRKDMFRTDASVTTEIYEE
jgi:hypothetical protein